jgi:hypothetical protein
MLYSTGGIGQVDQDFTAQTLPVHYRILGASFTTHSKGSQPGGRCAAFGGTSGYTTLTGTLTGPAQDDPTNKLDYVTTATGPLSGGIYAKAASTITTEIDGCEFGPSGHLQACTRSSAGVPLSAAFNIGFNIWVPTQGSGDATIHWMANVAGFTDHLSTCGVSIYIPAISYDRTTLTIPTSKLLSTDPQTYTLSDSIHFDHDSSGTPASIDEDWSYSITVQRT